MLQKYVNPIKLIIKTKRKETGMGDLPPCPQANLVFYIIKAKIQCNFLKIWTNTESDTE